MGTFGQIVTTTNINENIRYITLRVLDSNTSQAVAGTVGGDYVPIFGATINNIYATVDTAGTTGLATINVKKNGTTIFSTKITIDSGEKTSATAATPPVLSVTTFVANDIFTVDIDGIQTTPAKGLSIEMKVTQTS